MCTCLCDCVHVSVWKFYTHTQRAIQVSISIASVLCAKPLALLAVRLAEILIQMKAVPSPITKESDLLAYSVKYAKNSEIVL